MKFVDIAQIRIKAGDGGIGMVHFRREKYVPAGGPDGGHGGDGGSIYMEAVAGLATLLDFRYVRMYQAGHGGKGGTSRKHGKRGEELVLKVPCGTQAYDEETKDFLGEVLHDGQKILLASGGRGGIGNSAFASSRNQAPEQTVSPTSGQERLVLFELKMLADVGIIGSPNAGKSTLICVISAARPKVADYPFTTLVPTLGVVSYKDYNPFVVADVPGLIPGASQGKGLGIEFLRHIERTRVLLHLIDAGSEQLCEDMEKDFDGILQELKLYNPTLLLRPRLTVLSKCEEPSEEREQFKSLLKARFPQLPILEISSASRLGIENLLQKITELLEEKKA